MEPGLAVRHESPRPCCGGPGIWVGALRRLARKANQPLPPHHLQITCADHCSWQAGLSSAQGRWKSLQRAHEKAQPGPRPSSHEASSVDMRASWLSAPAVPGPGCPLTWTAGPHQIILKWVRIHPGLWAWVDLAQPCEQLDQVNNWTRWSSSIMRA